MYAIPKAAQAHQNQVCVQEPPVRGMIHDLDTYGATVAVLPAFARCLAPLLTSNAGSAARLACVPVQLHAEGTCLQATARLLLP